MSTFQPDLDSKISESSGPIEDFRRGVYEVEVLLSLISSSLPGGTDVEDAGIWISERAAAEHVAERDGVPPEAERRERVLTPTDSKSSSIGGQPHFDVEDEMRQRENAVRRASVVLLVSHFESYLKALAEDFIEALSSGRLEARHIPFGIRELHTIPSFEAVLAARDESQRAGILKKFPPLAQLWNESAKPPRGALNADLLTGVVTSARDTKIDNLFALMGSRQKVCDGDIDVSDASGAVASVSIRLSLEDVVQCRNSIAHGDADRKPTHDDIERYVRFLTALAERLERKANSLKPPA